MLDLLWLVPTLPLLSYLVLAMGWQAVLAHCRGDGSASGPVGLSACLALAIGIRLSCVSAARVIALCRRSGSG